MEEEISATTRKMLDRVPDRVVLAEARKRAKALRAAKGRYATGKVFRKCKGCGKEFSAREMRTHECVISWPRR